MKTLSFVGLLGATLLGASALLAQGGPGSGSSGASGLVKSKSGLNVRLGGRVELEYKQVEENSRRGTVAPENKAPYGFDIDKAVLNLDLIYDDPADHEYEIARAKVEFEFNESGAFIDEAYLLFNRPLARHAIPGKEFMGLGDSLLIGLEDVFWKNPHRVSENYSLPQNAFARDERFQFTYTMTAFEYFYGVGGISDGSTLAVSGNIDEAGNYEILQDDRSAFFNGFSDKANTSHRLEAQAGLGMLMPFDSLWGDGAAGTLFNKKPFRPMDVKEENYFSVLWFYTHDRLSDTEKTLLDPVMSPTSKDRKWRTGGTADIVYAPSDSLTKVFLHGDYVHAQDAMFRRDAWSVEGSIKIDVDGALPMITSLRPFVRYGALTTNRNGPSISAGSSDADITSALIVTERKQFTLGARFDLHKYLYGIFEYTNNNEYFNTPTGVSNEVDNDAFVLNIRFSW